MVLSNASTDPSKLPALALWGELHFVGANIQMTTSFPRKRE
jgi:hypothetical protein